MQSKIIILVVVVSFLLSFTALAEEEGLIEGLEGSITLEGRIGNIAGDKAKFNEYRDIKDGFGLYSKIRLRYDTEKYFLNFKSNDIGYDTQSYRLDGGRWGKFKIYFDYHEIPHHFTFDARSFYAGVGGNILTYPTHPPSTHLSTWDDFDYSIERRHFGGGFKWEFFKPFFFDVSAFREEREGIFPVGVAGTTPGGIAIELPEPIDFTTNTIKLETGYTKNPLFLSLGLFFSQFENDHNTLFFRNPSTVNTASTMDAFTLPPDNQYYKLAFKGSLKLPLRSRFNMNLGFSRANSEADLFNSYVANVAGGRTGITISDLSFKGKMETQNYNFVFTSNPLSFLDGKIFYRHYRLDNKSDKIITMDDTDTFINHLFDYKKDKAGLELRFRLPMKLHLTGAYHHVRTEREREDIPKNKDNILSIDLRWAGIDFMIAKVGFEKLYRDAKFNTVRDPLDFPNIETFLRRYDAAEQDRDTYKVSVDLSPIENLNFGIEYKHKEIDYKKTILGLQKEKRDGIDLDADYTAGKYARIFGYFLYERIKNSQFQRQFVPADSPNPVSPPTSSAFNWDVTQKDGEYDYGIGTEIFIIPNKLTLTLQHDYVRSNGSADFTYFLGANPLPAGRTQDNIDISDWDDYRLKSYMIKATYKATKRFSFSLGYAYEKFRYKDAQLDGYQFVPAISGTNGAYLTGAYKDPSYSGSIVFLGVSYKF